MTTTPFVCIEGLDGAGKSQQAGQLAAALRAAGEDPLLIAFPDRTTPIGHIIDGYLHGYWSVRGRGGADERVLNAKVFQALQVANRMERMPSIVWALENARPVVVDRYWPSGYVYGKADGLDPEQVLVPNLAMPQPRLFVLLDVPVGVAVGRQVSRGKARERYERAVGLLAAVRGSYLELWEQRARMHVHGQVWVVLDGSRPEADVAAQLLAEYRKVWG